MVAYVITPVMREADVSTDISPVEGVITIAVGQETAALSVNIIQDDRPEVSQRGNTQK